MKRLIVLLIVFCVGAAASEAATTYPDRWLTKAEAVRLVKSRTFGVLYCPPRTTCTIVASTGYVSGYREVLVRPVAATARGVGPHRTVAGNTRFHTFEIRACVVNYEAGAAQIGVRLFWNAGKVAAETAQLPAMKREYAQLRDLVLAHTATATRTARAKALLSEIQSLQAVDERTRPWVADWATRGTPVLRGDDC